MLVKTAPAATAPMANAYANATVLEKIENLVATFRHRMSNETSLRFLCLYFTKLRKIRHITKLKKSQP
ncbi:hypothetical protein F2Q69_00027799 [Brassica cretica]|uniref:Uncharacterized protein n=1 Tax=Brassica cretica TaxID=69181 RepID=A0A8S9S298_BRACR|nr:hypothetical protein F2Q69_00027799 [Brassica cretica]